MNDMSWSKKREYLKYLMNLRCFEFYPEGVILKSGKISNFYANLRKTTETLLSAVRLGEYIVTFCKEKHIILPSYNPGNYTVFYGVPEGAVKTGFFAQLTYLWNKPVVSKKDSSFSPGSLYYLKIKEKEVNLINLHTLTVVVNYLKELLLEESQKADSIFGDPKSIYREVAFLLGVKFYEYSKKNYYLPQLREKPKEHGLPEDKYFIGKPKGNVLILPYNLTSFLDLRKPLKILKKQQRDIKEIIIPSVFYDSSIKSRINESILPLESLGDFISFELIVIEDVVTTGTSVINEVQKLISLGLNVKAVIALYDRKETDVGKKLNNQGIFYYAMCNSDDVMPKIKKRKKEDF